MKTMGAINVIVAVIFIALLLAGSSAQASGLFALDSNPALAERQIGLFQQAFDWLSGAWTDFKVAFGADETAPPPSSNCTNPSGCGEAEGDSGWTIDPEG